MGLVEKVQRFCKKEGLLHQGDTIVIGCSGGPDSLALLDVLAALRDTYDLTLLVVYVHHGLRAAADEEVSRVQAEAEKRHCQCIIKHRNVRALAAAEKCSVETAGRNARYAVFRDVAAAYNAQAIAVGHHQNDQAETVLLHLLRGSGLTGLGGMHPRTGCIIRPLLCVSREEIEDYVKTYGLKPCHDETNDAPLFLRNRIRLEVLPFLQQYNPAVVSDLQRLAVLAQGDDAVLGSWTCEWYENHKQEVPQGVGFSKSALLGLPAGMQRRVLRHAVAAVTGSAMNIPFHHIEILRELCEKVQGKQFCSRCWQAHTTCDTLCIIRTVHAEPEKNGVRSIRIPGPGTYVLNDYILTLDVVETRPYNIIGAAVLDAEACSFPLTFRYREPGDVISLRGGRKKLKKYYIDTKIPASLRQNIPLLCAGSDVLWVYGYAVSRKAAATAQTARCVIGNISRRNGHA